MYLAIRPQTKSLQKQVVSLLAANESLLESKKSDEHAIRQLLDKTVTMLGTKDGLSYQQVMAMSPQTFVVPDQVYDSSDFGEYMKEKLGPHDPSLDEPSEVSDAETDVLARELGLYN